MTDKEFKKYIEKRCAEEPFEVPAFDGFFTEEELAGKTSPRHLFPLWSRIAAATAIAAAIALLVLLRPTGRADVTASDTCAMEEWIVSENLPSETLTTEKASEPVFTAQASTIRKPQDNHIITSKAPAGKEPLNSDDKEMHNVASATETTPENPPAETKEADDNVTSQYNMTSQYNVTSQYNKVWKEDMQMTRQKKHRKQVATIDLSFNCNNSLMAYNPSSESTVSMITRNYQSKSMLRSSSVNRNEWKVPENLNMTRAEIAAYTPVYNLPLTGAVSVSFPIGQHWDLRTGLTYTYLSANTYGKMDNSQSFSLYQHLHYLGIPLQFAFNILDNAFGLYVSAGGGLEKGLAGVQYSHVYDKDGQQLSCVKLTQSVAGVQPYVSFQVGASYRITDFLKVYLEPSLSYYFDTNQPISVRTKRPLYFGLGAGLRFATGK